MAGKLLSTSEVAKILGISNVAVFKKITSGKIKAQKVGGRYVIDSEQLGLSYKNLDQKTKNRIKKLVGKVFKEYGDVIKRLGRE